ncbi:hypothetical protein SSX86_020468 [Deinandra increscens subsp. villosa]|uniref:DUF674 domain-containing protein n=1 Tax=Deinandra increscens subsp. villosa TaxID=3103831 RepID=A0AAP0CN15_9ASTR
MATTKVSLKLLVDKKGERVLFGEAGKDFVDFLFSLLALPVGTVIRLLGNRNMEGGMAKIYKSVSDLNNDYIQSNQNKDLLLKPKPSLPFVSSKLPMLSTEAFSFSSSSSEAPNSNATFYKCVRCNIMSPHSRNCPGSFCCRQMTPVLKSAADVEGGGFVKGLVTYMVTDDLSVSPMSTISNITTLNRFNIKDFGDVEEKVVYMGMNEGLELLKHSLSSKTVLTDVFLSKVGVKDDNVKRSKRSKRLIINISLGFHNLTSAFDTHRSMASSSTVTLKLLIDKKRQRVLFAEAGKDFVDFLISLLALPVATVIRLLDDPEMVSGFAKLYQSVTDLNEDYILSNHNKDVILKPKTSLPFLSPPFVSRDHVLSDEVFSTPSPALNYSPTTLYKCLFCMTGLLATSSRSCCGRTMRLPHDVDYYVVKSEADANEDGFVKGLVSYMVTDDLVVSPMSAISNIISLNKFNVEDWGALEQKVVHVGMNEGRLLLKHALISKTVLTDVFLGGGVTIKDENVKKRSKS